MADAKVSALTETTSPLYTDDLYIVTDPGGTPASKRVSVDRVGLIKQKSVTLNNAQIKALPTTPVTILSAPGAGKLIVPMLAIIDVDVATAFTGIASLAALWVGHETESSFGTWGTLPLTPAGNSLSEGTRELIRLPPYIGAVNATWGGPVIDGGNTSGSLDDVAVQLFFKNYDNDFVDHGDLGGGGAGNSLEATLFYVIKDLRSV
jgi:hypothetical protein